MEVRDDDFRGRASGAKAVEKLGGIYQERFREREKTKRLLIAVVTFLFLAADAGILFAPPGKAVASWILGIVLIVLALGAIGVSKFLLKIPTATLMTDDHYGTYHYEIRERDNDR